jgi:outer membrane protein OmpA-like peptidoglycan-associated protein
LSKEINRAISKRLKIYVQKDGKTYQIKSEQAKANLSMFNYGMNRNFYRGMKKKTDSPFFNIKIEEDIKGKKILFNFDSSELNQKQLLQVPEIAQAYREFKTETDKLFNKMFKP